jgi:hypothetical protein
MAGTRIDDHKFWAGGKSKGSVFPEGVHHKEESTADGALPAHVGSNYSDTTEAIHRDQEHGMKKANAHKMKEGYRN